jgi:cytochrome P450
MSEILTEPPVFPMPRSADCPFDPPPGYRKLQAEAPITKVRLWDDNTAWLVTRYEDQRTLLADQRISADIMHPGYPHVAPGEASSTNAAAATTASKKRSRVFVAMDDPEHARIRRMVTAPFAIRRVEALRPAIQRIVDKSIDDMLAGPKPVDLVKAFALPVPSLVICELLGVPYAGHDFFQRNSQTIVNRGSSPEAVLEARANLEDYLEELIAEKLAEPSDDLLSTLAAERVTTGELARNELAALGFFLLAAGHETTANMIALGTLALLQHPDQLAELRQTDDPKLVASAVDELLRYLNVLHMGRRRVALADVRIGDHLIKAGDGVILALDVGNRQDDIFADPDQLDIHRDARRHLAFGFGVHRCLGGPLARVELEVVYNTLFRRIPQLRLAVDIADVPFKHDGLVYGVYHLPVTW